MSDQAQNLLSRLEGVRPTSRDSYVARCPAHKDRSPSLRVTCVPDGRVLIHCFAGCGVDQVLGAIGLELSDLFPPKVPDDARPPRIARPYTSREAVRALYRELTVAWVILADVASGKELTPADRRRAGLARDRCIALIGEIRDE